MKYDEMLMERLEKEIDEDYASFSKKIMQTNKLIGVRVPILKKIAKEFSIYDDFVYNVTLNTFEEVAVVCFYIGQNCKDIKKLKEYIDYILPYIDNWGNCDIFASSIKLLKTKLKNEFLSYIYEYLGSGDEFTVRLAVVLLLDHYLTNQEITNEILHKVYKKQGKTYYIDMAIAWLVSVAFIKFRDCALSFLRSGLLNKQVQNKSISKICDSLRVSKEDKTLVKTLRFN